MQPLLEALTTRQGLLVSGVEEKHESFASAAL